MLTLLKFEARPEPSRVAGWISPLLAAGATLIVGFVLFTAMGKNPWVAFHAFFVKPVATIGESQPASRDGSGRASRRTEIIERRPRGSTRGAFRRPRG